MLKPFHINILFSGNNYCHFHPTTSGMRHVKLTYFLIGISIHFMDFAKMSQTLNSRYDYIFLHSVFSFSSVVKDCLCEITLSFCALDMTSIHLEYFCSNYYLALTPWLFDSIPSSCNHTTRIE